MGLAVGMTLKFLTSMTKGLKLKVKVLGTKSYVCRSYRGKTGRGGGGLFGPPSWIGLKQCNQEGCYINEGFASATSHLAEMFSDEIQMQYILPVY